MPVIEYREVTVEVVKEVEIIREVTVEVPIELRNFSDLQELEVWLEEDDTDRHFYFTGKIDDKYDCEDYAFALINNAREDGYDIHLQIQNDHAFNSTIIGNNIYFIEPSNDKVWLAHYLD